MSDNFMDRMRGKLSASGEKGRMDLEMHDSRVIESGKAVRVLATYSDLYGAPSVLDLQSWLGNKLGAFANKVNARVDTLKVMPEANAVTFILERKRISQPLDAVDQMVKAGPDTYLDTDNQLWEVVKAGEGKSYIVKKEATSIEEMLDARKDALRGAASARKQVTLAGYQGNPGAGGGYAQADLGDVVDFYHNGMIHRGKVASVSKAGVRVTTLSGGDDYTVDPGAISSIVEKSAGAMKEQDDTMRRYWSLVYPGNPAMTEILSPLSDRPVSDNRPRPSGEDIKPIEVAASAGVVSGSARPFGKTSK